MEVKPFAFVRSRRGRSPGSGDARSWLSGLAAAAAFWTAVLLPMGYVSVLLRNLESEVKLAVLLALLWVHAIALAGGRNYRSEGASTTE